jgi:ubiquinone/menaquinone biosynthesis C-methylase UbiE
MSEFYDSDQLKELEEGWWFYDHAWSLLHCIICKIKGKNILDVGCGSGLAMSVIQAAKPEIKCTGVEPTNDLIDLWALRGVTVKQSDAAQLPFSDGQFDCVYSSHVLEHIQDDLTAAKEMIRVTNGVCIIIVPEGDCQDKNLGSPHLRIYNRVNFLDMVKKAVNGVECTINLEHHQHSHINSLVAIVEKI